VSNKFFMTVCVCLKFFQTLFCKQRIIIQTFLRENVLASQLPLWSGQGLVSIAPCSSQFSALNVVFDLMLPLARPQVKGYINLTSHVETCERLRLLGDAASKENDCHHARFSGALVTCSRQDICKSERKFTCL